MNDIAIFRNEKFGEIRTTEVNGEPMFCALDVCNVLGYSNPSKAIADHVDNDERYNESLERGGTLLFISESGLYSLVIRSNKPNAKPFRKWVTSEVLPAIRKTGSYTMALPKTYSEALRQLAYTVEAKEKIQLQLEAKIEQLDESKDWYTIKRWAKEHHINWRKISWRALKAISIEHGYEIKKIFDGNYGEVNLYHKQVFAILYDQ